MNYKRYCKGCGVDREINIWEVYNQQKKRVVCGHCGTVLIKDRLEIEALWWTIFGCDS